ncbi:hypothetical protein CLOBOL_05426 [Enterocloster bolteae ATCC BAA-613]|uniref:Uncharacterized protein n=1 Tax=Enterocloster bolteae (strain ATCC BAA-613 / DSM 15670 / CCUG 46953 / JCM 12243 / WAL 16351) TaxID=411902 RepID=A8RZI6_ENTBW|nr:hypothetical protein CLOBOL_05426 [Enterocloster bolteae ATCC BAA-613]
MSIVKFNFIQKMMDEIANQPFHPSLFISNVTISNSQIT